jgi:hypothetical protein
MLAVLFGLDMATSVAAPNAVLTPPERACSGFLFLSRVTDGFSFGLEAGRIGTVWMRLAIFQFQPATVAADIARFTLGRPGRCYLVAAFVNITERSSHDVPSWLHLLPSRVSLPQIFCGVPLSSPFWLS